MKRTGIIGAVPAALPADEEERLAGLQALAVLDSAPEPVFDSITRLAADICGTPIALVSLVDTERQWFKSATGLPGISETPRDIAFCAHTILGRELMEVVDATLDTRFARNPFVISDPHVRFYAGAPLILPGGHAIGTLCVIDHQARQLDAQQRQQLAGLADVVTQALITRQQTLAAVSVKQRQEHDRALAASEERFRQLYEATPAMLHSIDMTGRMVSVSDEWLRTLGYTREEVIGRASSDFLSMASRRHAQEVTIPVFFRDGFCHDVPYEFLRKDGSVVDVLLSAIVERDASGRPMRSLAVLQDVTERKLLAQTLAEQHERLRVTLHSIGDAVITTDTQGIIDYMNPVAVRLTGWLASEAHGAHIREVFNVIHDTARTVLPNPVIRCLEDDCVASLSDHTLLVSRDGGERDIADSAAPIRTASGELLGAVLVFHDITEQRQKARDISYRASHDPLTGLFNRSEFESRLGRLVESSRGRRAEHALMFIDLDHFKTVNDNCGHAAGDELLRQLSTVLQQSVRVRDMLARLGGDEFGLIMEHCSLEQAQRNAQLLCERINDYRFVHDDRRFRVGGSIGLVPMDGRWNDAESVLAAADAACYTAKQTGRNRVHTWFDSDDVAHMAQREAWSQRLESALQHDQFELFAQCMTPLQTEDTRQRMEILLRLRDADGSLIPPGAFLPEAGRFKLAARIDYWVLDHVLKLLDGTRVRLDAVDTISINLSQESVIENGYLESLCRRLINAGDLRRRLCFEFGESVVLSHPEEACRFATEMLKLGVRIGLDDFGHGASPFRYLRDMPVDYLKVGSHLTRHVDTDPMSQAGLRCVRDVSLALGMQTVAVRVEEARTLDRLRELGIHYAQGYVVGRPAPLAELL
ncbi:MAG: EAL domain-containing protein [Moraxellaceae bacterium]|nr:EAL domain-containing protein [Moraxellaceae bacterium]